MSAQESITSPAERAHRFALGPSLWVPAIYGVLVLGASLWGVALRRTGEDLGLGAPPLFGDFDLRLSLRVIPAVALAALVVAFGHRVAERVSWGALLALSFLGAAGWAVVLAATDGWSALTGPVLNPLDAYLFAQDMGAPGEFLRMFTERIASFPIHVQGHPPGLPLLLNLIAGTGPGVVAALYIAAGAAIAPSVLVAARAVSDEKTARAAAPWLVLAPYAVWLATSADALYSGVAAWGIALIVSSLPGDRIRPLCGGALFGGALFLTYGAAGLVLIPVIAAVRSRNFASLILAGVGAAVVATAFAAAGFWWLDGLAATRVQYYAGLGGLRPYGYFLFANLAVLAIACGPGALRGLAGVRSRLGHGATWLSAGALVAVGAANLSGLSKGETERIWLLFYPWIVLGGACIVHRRRWWLGAGGASALLVQIMVASPW